MGTKIEVLYDKPLFCERYNFEEPFYCKESPFQVLRALFPKFHVKQYNSLETNFSTLQGIKPQAKSSGIQPGNSIWIHGLSIKEFNDERLKILGRLKNYNYEEVMNDSYANKGEKILREFVGAYLIDRKTIDAGIGVQNWKGEVKVHKRKIQEIIEYVNVRDVGVNPAKEKNLEDILDYGKVVLGKRFDLQELKRISGEIAASIPTETKPTNIYNHNLKPDFKDKRLI